MATIQDLILVKTKRVHNKNGVGDIELVYGTDGKVSDIIIHYPKSTVSPSPTRVSHARHILDSTSDLWEVVEAAPAPSKPLKK